MKLYDCHCHTEFAYCGQDITAADALAAAKSAGLAGLCITEHAPQLYSTADDFWAVRHVYEPQVWRSPENSRMAEFKKFIQPMRSEYLRVGFEVELDIEGNLTIHEEDRQWADIILGAIHWLPDYREELSREKWDSLFLDVCRKILDGGVDILAHPFRKFNSKDRPIDNELYVQLADMLVETNTAAEINFHHTSRPDPYFFSLCIERGVKISFGTDSHMLTELADLSDHLALLRDAAGRDDVEDLLYIPPPGKGNGL